MRKKKAEKQPDAAQSLAHLKSSIVEQKSDAFCEKNLTDMWTSRWFESFQIIFWTSSHSKRFTVQAVL